MLLVFDCGVPAPFPYPVLPVLLLAPPLLILLLFIGNDRSIMGAHVNSRLSNVFVGITALIMGGVAIALIYSLLMA